MKSDILSLVQHRVGKGRSLATNKDRELKAHCTDQVHLVTVFIEGLKSMSPTHSKSKQAALLMKDFVLWQQKSNPSNPGSTRNKKRTLNIAQGKGWPCLLVCTTWCTGEKERKEQQWKEWVFIHSPTYGNSTSCPQPFANNFITGSVNKNPLVYCGQLNLCTHIQKRHSRRQEMKDELFLFPNLVMDWTEMVKYIKPVYSQQHPVRVRCTGKFLCWAEELHWRLAKMTSVLQNT